ncbi:2-amino-4-hydroxy-6-hydroxymethyldihydropteridine diphosphokinase [Flavobacterium suzhouense]|uniref:2-amino-4-hydroxy-6-hydroxymethyldihydropteridine pyrophosphokinase n=1 Tax=Flavobacterium suzhouense TaxID=1529638 RepID=A0ABW5NNM0_9FLAO
MRFQNKAILSLGSNMGNRLENLQWCIDYINNHIATVVKVSGIYENPSVGFEGDDFYNCCLLVHTQKPAVQLLAELLGAELEGGRVRNPEERYHSRTIDIDVITFNNEIIAEPTLEVPHPRMQNRNFVLIPLRDVAPHWEHPKFKKNINQLITESGDESKCEFVVQLPSPIEQFNPKHHSYIAIEGNIGAGKTSLAGKLSEDFGGQIVLERFADNPFLPQFYKDPQRYAFSLEMSFLADRYQQLSDDLLQVNPQTDFVVADYHIIKSLIFSKVTLGEDEYTLYKKLFDIMYGEMRRPGLYVYLYQTTETLLKHIKLRGRSYEQEIEAEYLDKINQGYLDYIKTHTGLNVLVLDVSNRDFVHNQEDYVWVLEQVNLNR